MTKGELDIFSGRVQKFLEEQMEETLDRRIKDVKDMLTEKKRYNEWSTNKWTGEKVKDYTSFLKNVENAVYGRASVDSKGRAINQNIISRQMQAQDLLGVREHTSIKDFGYIKKGSKLEAEVFKRTAQITEHIDPRGLDKAGADALLKKYGDTEVDRLALVLKLTNEHSRLTSLQYGVDVKFRGDFVSNQKIDASLASKLTPQAFADKLLDVHKLDFKKSFGEGVTREEAVDILKKMHTTTLESQAIQTDILSGSDFKGYGVTNQARKLMFSDLDGRYSFFNDFTSGGLVDELVNGIRSTAYKAASVSTYGYNPNTSLQKVFRKALLELPEGKKANINSLRKERINQAVREQTGQASIPVSALNDATNVIRMGMSVGKLGNALNVAMLDPLDNARQVFHFNGKAFGGIGTWQKNFAKFATMDKGEQIRIAAAMQNSLHFVTLAQSSRMSSELGLSGSNKILEMFNAYSGKAMNIATLLPKQTEISQMASASVAIKEFTESVSKLRKGEKFNKFELDSFKEYGFSEKELFALAHDDGMRTKLWSDDTVITGQGIRDSLMAKAKENIKQTADLLGVAEQDLGDAISELALKYEMFVTDFTVRGTPTPEMKTKTAMGLLGKNSNNVLIRNVSTLMTQFLDTPVAQTQYLIEVIGKLSRINDGSILGSMKDYAPHSVAYITAGMAMYLGTDAAMSLVLNKKAVYQRLQEGDDRERAAIMLNVFDRISYVPFAAGVAQKQFIGRHDETAFDAFGSPALATGRDLLKINSLETAGRFAKSHLGGNTLIPKALNNWSAAAFDVNLLGNKTFFEE